MKIKNLILIVCSIFMLYGCYSLKKPIVTGSSPIGKYKYAYISPTAGYTSGAGGIFGGKYGLYGASTTKSVNPSNVIAGTLIKEGLVMLPELKPELADETLIVNYGESGRRTLFMVGYTTEVTIQFLNAKTMEKVCSCTAEGFGETQSDDIRKAILRSLKSLFKKR